MSRGLTLMEVLAVTVILTLVAGVSMVRLASSSDSGRWQASISACRELDGLARLHAEASRAVVMTTDVDGRSLRLHPVGSDELLSFVALPRDATARLVRANGDSAVVFDRRGRSDDYELLISLNDAERRWQVTGLTGLITEASP